MNSRAENFYAVWRERCRAVSLFHDGSSEPPEKLLQAIWQHQRLRREELKTVDGKSLRVLHPGFASAEGGPDFRGAVLQFDGEAPVVGDVEVDVQTSGWHAHGHDSNPNFENVVLHVIWDGAGVCAAAGLPTSKPGKLKLELQPRPAPIALPLKSFLDAPSAELALALENESGLPENLRGKCSAPLREFSEPQLSEMLHAAAKVRFQNKANAMLARAKQSGWEQALWENLFRALGYKHNVWAMQNLAEQRTRLLSGLEWKLRVDSPDRLKPELQPELQRRRAENTFALQARLLGVSGLLPEDLTRTQKNSDTFLRRAWDVWWRDRDELADCILPRTVWKFHGLRPANHPQRRLALASHWLAGGNLVPELENWIAAELVSERRPPAEHWLRSLHQILQVERDEFWSWHWTFKSARLTKPQVLLGEARVTDLAVNVVLPWLWIRAREGGNEKILREVERRFFAWPAAEDNSILKLARQRLLGTSRAQVLRGAAQQQGLMQIVRDFCEHANATCADCRFPEVVRGFNSQFQPEK